jgi:cell division protein FtsI/penicillin-binding protein 2
MRPSAAEISAERRHRVRTRLAPALAGVALAALVAGVVAGAGESGAERTARNFAEAWLRSDFEGMHSLLSAETQARYPRADFERAYRDAAATATVEELSVDDPDGERDGAVVLPLRMRTRMFGEISRDLLLPVEEERVEWSPNLVFPGLAPGQQLTRQTRPPRRGRLLSRDRKVLAEGPPEARVSPLGPLGGSIAGSMGEADGEEERRKVYARGFDADTPIGISGLERIFERELAGTPSGRLLAGSEVVATGRGRPGANVRSTIDSVLQQAAVTALAGRLGGVAALDARTAEVRALAGIAFSAPQPPGSTFKIVTTTPALEQHKVRKSDEFPIESYAVIDGVQLENANGEFCGGSFKDSFAHSCNSVFAPLGVKVGAEALVDAAERYGFNARPSLVGEMPSTLPPADEIVSPLEVGSTAIGQGKVLATPLVMASIAQTVAAEGIRTVPSLRRGGSGRQVRVTRPQVARVLEELMVDVVEYGTGTAAAIPGVQVAGKTGTAELEDTRGPEAELTAPDPLNTDAWFTAYAPAGRPKVAVAVLLVRAGSGGATAAPAARIVLDAAL